MDLTSTQYYNDVLKPFVKQAEKYGLSDAVYSGYVAQNRGKTLTPGFVRAINSGDLLTVLRALLKEEYNGLKEGSDAKWDALRTFIDRRTNGLLSSAIGTPAVFVGVAKSALAKAGTKFYKGPYQEELFQAIHGAAKNEDWIKLLGLFGISKSVESVVEDTKEIEFLQGYLPTIAKKTIYFKPFNSVKTKRGKRKSLKRPETDEELKERILKEAPRAFEDFLCEKYNILLSPCPP